MTVEDLNPEDISKSELEHLRSIMSEMTEVDAQLEAPPASLWAGIELTLRSDAAATAEVDGGVASPAESDNVVELNPRRNRGLALAAAAALTVVTALGVSGLFRTSPNEAVVASVDITNAQLPVQDDAFGTAKLISVGGDLQLEIDIEQLEADSGYLELWIINSDVTDMHSLGEVSGDGRYDVPDDVDPANFPIVDISFEDRDGVETHSGNSVLRGVLDL